MRRFNAYFRCVWAARCLQQKSKLLLFLAFYMTSITLVACQTSGTERFGSETRLVDDLLDGYRNQARPVFDAMDPVNVSVSFDLIQIEDIDEKNQILRIFAWLGIFWKDAYLTWDPSQYGGINTIVLDSRKLWTPDIVVRNSATEVYSDLTSPKFKSIVSSNGSVVMFTAGKVSVNCPLELTKFPFDQQTCPISLDSWVYNGQQMVLENATPDVSMFYYTVNGQWDVVDGPITSSKYYYDGEPTTPYYNVLITLNFKRKPLFYMINVLLPCMILSLLVLLVFYLPVNSGEKVSLGITVLLSFSVFQLLVADVMPKTSDNTPAISMYLVSVMALAGLSILCTLIVLSVHHCDSPRRPPRWQRRLIFDVLAKVVMMDNNPFETKQPETKKISSEKAHMESNGVTPNPRVQTLSSLLFRRNKREPTINERRVQDVSVAMTDEMTLLREASQDVNTTLLLRIERSVGRMVDKLESDKGAAKVKEEWVAMATILDRFFLLLFLVATVLVGVLLLGVVPHT